MLPPKSRPRFLPTLTHVVTQAELVAVDQSGLGSQVRGFNGDHEQRVQHMVENLMPNISAGIREALLETIDEKLHHLEANLRDELESLVRRAMNACDTSGVDGPR